MRYSQQVYAATNFKRSSGSKIGLGIKAIITNRKGILLSIVLVLSLLGSTLELVNGKGISLTGRAMAAGEQIYWGGYLDGGQYGYGDAPWDVRTMDTFEQHAGKAVSIIHWGQFWHWTSQSGYSGIGDGYFQKFDTTLYERVRQRGSIPMINWNSWAGEAGGSANQPNYQLIDIINGTYDAYIRQWARDAKAWGKPFFLRFDHEMNGTWYPWSEQANGNQPGQYIQAWRHVHDLFTQEGANNVTWVWSINTEYSNPYSSNLEGLYPGDAYVDWVAIDGYNWGTNPAKPDSWKSFAQVFTQTYNHLSQVAPNKPIMLSEFASTEYGGSKASWISDALGTQIPSNFPRIKAIVWFNNNAYEGSGQMDWVIESSSSAQNAFANGIASTYYAANNFAGLTSSPIQPLSSLPSPTATPTSGATATPTATPVSPPGPNLLINPSFETTGSSWLTPWSLNIGSGAAGDVAQDNSASADGIYSAKVSVTTAAPSAPWGLQLRQKNLVLTTGNTYNVSFWAKASAGRDIDVVVQMGATPFTVYFNRTVTLGTSWQLYEFTFTQPTADTNAMLAFNMAQTTGQVWVDGAVFGAGNGTLPTATPTPAQTSAPTATKSNPTPTPTQVATATPVAPTATLVATPTATPSANLLQNPSFENTGSSWELPWDTVIDSGAMGTTSQDGSTSSDGSYSARVDVTDASPSSPWGVQLNQKSLSLSAGTNVMVTFWAKASSKRDVMVVTQMGYSPYTEYHRETIKLDTTWKKYEFTYAQPTGTTNGMLSFDLAKFKGEVWIDQVALVASGG